MWYVFRLCTLDTTYSTAVLFIGKTRFVVDMFKNIQHSVPGLVPENMLLMYDTMQDLYDEIFHSLPDDCKFQAHCGWDDQLIDNKDLWNPTQMNVLLIDDLAESALRSQAFLKLLSTRSHHSSESKNQIMIRSASANRFIFFRHIHDFHLPVTTIL